MLVFFNYTTIDNDAFEMVFACEHVNVAKTVDCGFGLRKFRYSPSCDGVEKSVQPVFIVDSLRLPMIDSSQLMVLGPVFDVASMWRGTGVDVQQLSRLKTDIQSMYDLVLAQRFPIYEFSFLTFNLINTEFNQIGDIKSVFEQSLDAGRALLSLRHGTESHLALDTETGVITLNYEAIGTIDSLLSAKQNILNNINNNDWSTLWHF
ncbi:hypothetical protein [Vibrio agarivorans]|uniref:Uncharacterized protein n=1 Tax=Vibrio agarivorans TaxID=153622 RepID=A0ABT7Y774_9VIBR|nr:hypothetical protein [Vibrio agarivorans]MDN2483899.1 hypothetical protein [Vibrio agarivorans]